VRAQPANNNIRQAIRQGGIEFIERIHQSNEHDRIVLVGHGLGPSIVYDILNHLWTRDNKFPYT
jgi:4-hydroxy-3-methylbut-2-enyl diphosphate reductase IspH